MERANTRREMKNKRQSAKSRCALLFKLGGDATFFQLEVRYVLIHYNWSNEIITQVES